MTQSEQPEGGKCDFAPLVEGTLKYDFYNTQWLRHRHKNPDYFSSFTVFLKHGQLNLSKASLNCIFDQVLYPEVLGFSDGGGAGDTAWALKWRERRDEDAKQL